ncbi:MAG: aldehyde dehydrogenase [Planctomycetota bacterium]|nr:MAG: aldehyde dehydrogenase [Planctomycetota bacterium]
MTRVDVRKTYKLFIGGKFPRSESGRTWEPDGAQGTNVALGSRKDLRDAVAAARGALGGWAGKTAYNRGQILYRLAEVLETRKASLAEELRGSSRLSAAAALKQVELGVDLLTFWAGVPDKLQQLLGSQNEVSGPFFNFSTVEPTGVVGAVAPDAPALVGCLALLAPLLAGGNTVVLLTSEDNPLPGLALGELLAVSDVPGGVVNLLAGRRAELSPQFASHRDVDGLLLAGEPDPALGAAASDSVKRVRNVELTPAAWRRLDTLCTLHWARPFVELKTLWHPKAP